MRFAYFECDRGHRFSVDVPHGEPLPPWGAERPCESCDGTARRPVDAPATLPVTAAVVAAAAHNRAAITDDYKRKAARDAPYMDRVRQRMRESNKQKLLAGKSETRWNGSVSVAEWNAKIRQHGVGYWNQETLKRAGGAVDG